jgi:hypothetical protein
MKLTERTHVATLVSGLGFIVGIALAIILTPYFALFAAVAAFLPDLLRLAGYLRDIDEFQAEVAGNAARAAVAVAAVYLALMYAAADTLLQDPESQQSAWLIAFALILATRYLVYVVSYWNPRLAALRVLFAFGGFWAAFIALSEWGSWTAMAIEALVVVVPFAVAGLLARRFPRVVGWGCLALAVGAIVFFNLHRMLQGDLGAFTVFVLIPVPLATIGAGLIRHGREVSDEEET